MFVLENSCWLTAFAALANGRLRRLSVRWKLQEACWRRTHAHCRRWRRGHAPPVRKPNPNLNLRPPRSLFCLKVDNSCCYARYSCGNNCNVVVKLVQEYHCFLYILLPFCGNTSPQTTCFLGMRTVTRERSARVKKLAAAQYNAYETTNDAQVSINGVT